jgi:hypothetical protein
MAPGEYPPPPGIIEPQNSAYFVPTSGLTGDPERTFLLDLEYSDRITFGSVLTPTVLKTIMKIFKKARTQSLYSCVFLFKLLATEHSPIKELSAPNHRGFEFKQCTIVNGYRVCIEMKTFSTLLQ